MNIAILVWGSLFWDSKDLAFTGEWFYDGPHLPIEFARISGGSRVTLVIKPNYPTVPTLYCVSSNKSLDTARENLRIREGTENIDNIGYIDFNSNTHFVRPNNSFVIDIITSWNRGKKFDAIIWSDFAPNFYNKLNIPLSTVSIVNFILNLRQSEKESAKQYIRNAPTQIQTRFRLEIEMSF